MDMYVPLKPCTTNVSLWNQDLDVQKFPAAVWPEIIMTPSIPSTSTINNISRSLSALCKNIKKKEAHNLGVIFDSVLSFDGHITRGYSPAQLRHLMKIRSFLSTADLEKVIYAFISSWHGYCNALYFGISRENIQRLHLIQNAAARLLTRTKRSKHITLILTAPHW